MAARADPMKPLGRPFAIGRTAEVYAWEDGLVLKLYYDWCPPGWVEYEAQIAQLVQRAGLPVPAVGEIVEVSGRRGILYERVDGLSMLQSMQRNPTRLFAYGQVLGRLHAEMHRIEAPDLPSQRDRLAHAIQSAPGLPEDLRAARLAELAEQPEGMRLCHADFHPDNVIITRKGPVIIDWMTARRGEPASDVARTRLLLTIGEPVQKSPAVMLMLLGRGLFFRSYARAYRAIDAATYDASDRYLPAQAAARLNEQIPGEQARLLKIAGQGGQRILRHKNAGHGLNGRKTASRV